MRVMVVDDSRVMRQIVSRTLRQAGFDDLDIVQAENGRQALEMVYEDAPDVVLCDWNMPEMTGIEFLEALRGSGSALPFGFVTSESSPEMRERAEAAGASFLVVKPFTAETFRDVLDPIVG